MAGFAFVDDMDLIVTNNTNDEKVVTLKMQNSLHLWHRLLQATGGDLVPEKCFWYLINFQWEHNQKKKKKWKDNDQVLCIPQTDGTNVRIPHLDTCEARHTLGVRLAPDGNNEAEYVHLHKEALQWKNHMISANLPRAVVDFGIWQVLLPKLCYPLVATTFTKAQCQGIMKPVLQQGLPALGVNRNFPRSVAHGLVTYQGLNLPNLHSEQMISHILKVLKYGNQWDDPTGVLLQTCGELLWLEVWFSGPLFKLSPHLHVCTMDTWFSHCWYACIQRGIDEDIKDFSLPWERDQMIMEVFLCTGYRSSELATLNQCRMYLQVVFLSDICNGHGMAIENQFWTGKAISDKHHYCWPWSHKPTQGEWALWQLALMRSLHLGNTQQLPMVLGRWYSTTRKLNGWFTDEAGLQLYWQKDHTWSTFTPLLQCRQLRLFISTVISLAAQELPL